MKDPKKQHDLDLRYLRMAQIWSENSYCQRRQVGALVVKDKMIISDGYNGTPTGFENVCEDDNNVSKPYVLHAEANAITKLARSSNNSDGSTIYNYRKIKNSSSHIHMLLNGALVKMMDDTECQSVY